MGLWSWLKGLFGKKEKSDEPLVSLVLLERELPYVGADMLMRLASRATGEDFTGDDDAENFVVGEPPLFFMRFDAMHFIIHAIPQPYMDDPEAAAAEITELRTQKSIAEHRAWLAVDLLRSDEKDDVAAGGQVIGKLVAELADANTLAIYCPMTDRLCVYDAALDAKLRGPNPLEEFADELPFVPVINIATDDPRMTAAEAEARRRWPEFVAAFEDRRNGQHFAAKAPFHDGDNTEYMWLEVTGLENDVIFGKLDNDPVEIGTVKCGDRVRVPVGDLNDWMVIEGDDSLGGFTIKVVEDAAMRKPKE